jgi:hypothetical protein
LKPIEPTVNRDSIQRQIDELENVKAKQYAKIGRVRDEELLERLIEETETQIDVLQRDMKAEPLKTNVDIDALVNRFSHFGTLPLAEQKKALRETFRRITIDRSGEITEIEFIDGRIIPFVPIDQSVVDGAPLM